MIRHLSVLALLLTGAAPAPGSVTVVVASRDYAAGEVVTFDGIAQKQVPSEWAGRAVVKPDAASYIVNQRTNLPILAGDLVRWSFFETRRGSTPPAGCGEFEGTALDQVARARQVLLAR